MKVGIMSQGFPPRVPPPFSGRMGRAHCRTASLHCRESETDSRSVRPTRQPQGLLASVGGHTFELSPGVSLGPASPLPYRPYANPPRNMARSSIQCK